MHVRSKFIHITAPPVDRSDRMRIPIQLLTRVFDVLKDFPSLRPGAKRSGVVLIRAFRAFHACIESLPQAQTALTPLGDGTSTVGGWSLGAALAQIRSNFCPTVILRNGADRIYLLASRCCHGARLLHRVMPCAPCADSAQDPQLDPRSPSQLAACIHTGDSFLSLTCARASAMSARTKRLLYL